MPPWGVDERGDDRVGFPLARKTPLDAGVMSIAGDVFYEGPVGSVASLEIVIVKSVLSCALWDWTLSLQQYQVRT